MIDCCKARESSRFMPALLACVALSVAQGVLATEDRTFGPLEYVRGKGEPRERLDRFAVAEPEADYVMVIRNLGHGKAPFNSATIRLNGEPVIDSHALAKHVKEIEIPVELAAENELAVTLRGAPGSKIVLEIVREDSLWRGKQRRVRELYLPREWAGQWQFDVEYFSSDTGDLVASEPVEAAFCPRDRVGLSSIVPRHPWAKPAATTCEGKAGYDHVGLSCKSRGRFAGCGWTSRFELDLERLGEAIEGSASFEITSLSGDCALVAGLPDRAQLSGTLLQQAAPDCTAPPASLLEKLVSEPQLVAQMPPAINDLVARTDGRHIRLRWSAVEQAARYRIYRARDEAPYRLIAVRPAGRHGGFHDRKADPGKTYRYVVTWIDRQGRVSPVSNEALAHDSSLEETQP